MLKKLLTKYFFEAQYFLNTGAKLAETRMIPYGVLGFSALLLFYLINAYLLESQRYDSLFPRVIGSLLCFFLIFKNYWPRKIKKIIPIYWYCTVMYTLPFFVTFMTLKNNLSAPWIMNELSMMILMMLLLDWISYLIVLVLGVLLAWIVFSLTTVTPFLFVPGIVNYKDIINTFLISLIMGMVFSRNRDIALLNKQFEVAKITSASIAHELRTPLATINAGLEGIQDYLPKLMKTYELAKEANLPIPIIRASHFKILKTSLDYIRVETNFSNMIINMLLTNIEQVNIKNDRFKCCSIADCVDAALSRYPFLPNEKLLVHWNREGDFNFYGDQLLTMHVLFNLLKNALFYIEMAGKGDIHIWLEQSSTKYNRLYFKDTGKGIDSEILPQIFEHFFTNSCYGAGVGLAYCKMIMKTYGGDILCESIAGKYAEFILLFPVLKLETN